jgi:hypothetical protein
VITGVYTFTAVADTYVQSDEPTTNFGRASLIRVDALPFRYTYLRFNVEGISDPILSAKLYVYANSTSRRGYEIRNVSSNGWDENTLTYQSRPARGEVVGISGGFSGGSWTEVAITDLVNGNGSLNLAMTGISSTSISLSSREGSQPPRLVVTTGTSAQGLVDPLDNADKKPLEAPEIDSDGDGMSDEDEVANGTNLSLPDSDGDGLPDIWEVEGGVDATSSSGNDGAQGDPDSDGISNLDEYNGRTDPAIPEGTLIEVATRELFLPLIRENDQQ